MNREPRREAIRIRVRRHRQRIREEQREEAIARERQRMQQRRAAMNEEEAEQERFRIRNWQHLRRNGPRVDGNADARIEPFSIGEMNLRCEHCGAYKFRNESFNCCTNGKVLLPPLQPYPEELKPLFDGRDEESVSFLKNIRNYNCAFSFISFGVKLAVPVGRGPYCFRVQGQTYHMTTTLHPQNERPQYGQLYIIDANEALQYRMEAPANQQCSARIMNLLNNVMNQCNPYVGVYKNMHLVEQQEQERAGNDQPRRCQLNFTRGCDIRRYNFPTSNEIAAVFVGENGAPPVNRDIIIYPNDSPPARIAYTSCHLDPMSYPLLFIHGEFGWHTELQHVQERRTRVRNKLFWTKLL